MWQFSTMVFWRPSAREGTASPARLAIAHWSATRCCSGARVHPVAVAGARHAGSIPGRCSDDLAFCAQCHQRREIGGTFARLGGVTRSDHRPRIRRVRDYTWRLCASTPVPWFQVTVPCCFAQPSLPSVWGRCHTAHAGAVPEPPDVHHRADFPAGRTCANVRRAAGIVTLIDGAHAHPATST